LVIAEFPLEEGTLHEIVIVVFVALDLRTFCGADGT